MHARVQQDGGIITCKKRIYLSIAEAKSMLSETKERRRAEKGYYRCNLCGTYHLTSRGK